MSGWPAPPPTMLNSNGTRQLNPRMPEWMMGYPPGWITDLVDRPPALRLAGNGVVAQLVAALYPIMVADWSYPQGGDTCAALDVPAPPTAVVAAPPTTGPRPARPGGGSRAGAVTASPAAEQLVLL